MTYDDAMTAVCAGSIVSIDSKTIYMSVDFNKGIAGEIVSFDSGKETIYQPTDAEKQSSDWSLVDNSSD